MCNILTGLLVATPRGLLIEAPDFSVITVKHLSGIKSELPRKAEKMSASTECSLNKFFRVWSGKNCMSSL